jgi:acyl phosphate:glycerol-3-phosphate acyltransferase
MPDLQALTFGAAIAAMVIGYLLGSIPFGLLLTRWAGLGDVRAIGSGNIGATNVLRMGNRTIAAATLICDALKGAIPVLLMGWWGGEAVGLLAGFAAFAGHLFPVWLKFKGGKGVATYIGVLFGLAWILGLAFLGVWLAVAFAFKRSSAAALAATALMPFAAWGAGKTPLIAAVAVLGAVIWITHRANIGRILAGAEPPINLGGKT